MEVYALDSGNIEGFSHLVTDAACEGIKQGDGTGGFVVKQGEQHVGALCGKYVALQAYEVTSFYVLPEARGQGVGELLLDTLTEVLSEQDTEVRIPVLALGDAKELVAFLEKRDYEEEQGERGIYALSLSKLLDSRLKPGKGSVTYPALKDVSTKEIKAFGKRKHREYVPFPEGGLTSEKIDGEVSTVILTDEKIQGYVLVETIQPDLVFVSSIYVAEEENTTELLKLIRGGLTRLGKKYKPETTVLFAPVNDASEQLLDSLFADGDRPESVGLVFKKFLPATKGKEAYDTDLSLDEFEEIADLPAYEEEAMETLAE